MSKLHETDEYIRERMVSPTVLRKQGYTRFRTKTEGDHKLIIAAKGPEEGGETRLQAILHPKSEASKLMERHR